MVEVRSVAGGVIKHDAFLCGMEWNGTAGERWRCKKEEKNFAHTLKHQTTTTTITA